MALRRDPNSSSLTTAKRPTAQLEARARRNLRDRLRRARHKPVEMSDLLGVGLDSSAERSLAEQGTILRATVGSTLHGLALAGADDRDEMGVCLEPREYVIGLRQFEQWVA